jgi:hypothetical protein
MKNNFYLSLNPGTTLNLFSPAPDSINLYSRYFEAFDYYSSSNYLNLRINKITQRFEYGIGISLSTLKWRSNNITASTDSTRFFGQSYYRSFNLGFSSAISYWMTPNFNVGLQYQPFFFDITRKKNTYQHFISIQLIYRF